MQRIMRRFVSVLAGGILGCAAVPAIAQPCCPCDFTHDNVVTSQDYFDYLTAFLTESPAADIDGNGDVTSQDYFEFVECFFTGCPNSADMGFRSTIGVIADCSYYELFSLGTSAFDILLDLTQEGGAYHGSAWHNTNSSIAPTEAISIPQMSLHLFDAILQGRPAPNYAPYLISSDENADPEAILSEAITLYTTWWDAHRGLSLDELRELSGPLEKSNIRWLGPLSDGERNLPEGTRMPDSDTPVLYLNGKASAKGTDKPYKIKLFPKARAGRKPYNCLAWAFGEDMVWMQPSAERGGTLNDTLTDYGYNTTPLTCDGQCPNGRGPKVMFVYILGRGERVGDSTWVHAMKQQADGKWTSKNGEDSRFNDVAAANYESFLDKSEYKAGPRQTRELRCYCK